MPWSDASNLLLEDSYVSFARSILSKLHLSTYPEVLQIIQADLVAKKVKQSILKHATVTVAISEIVLISLRSGPYGTLQEAGNDSGTRVNLCFPYDTAEEFDLMKGCLSTYERTNRSLFNHLGFDGLNLMCLLKRTWAAGASPIGAPSPRVHP